jgi:hypothetical protein
MRCLVGMKTMQMKAKSRWLATVRQGNMHNIMRAWVLALLL